jgi:hypothetical protein
MNEDRLPAAFDRTSLIGTEPYRAGSLGPRSPWSPERGDRRGFLPTPDPEAAGPGRQQRGWKVRNGAQRGAEMTELTEAVSIHLGDESSVVRVGRIDDDGSRLKARANRGTVNRNGGFESTLMRATTRMLGRQHREHRTMTRTRSMWWLHRSFRGGWSG